MTLRLNAREVKPAERAITPPLDRALNSSLHEKNLRVAGVLGGRLSAFTHPNHAGYGVPEIAQHTPSVMALSLAQYGLSVKVTLKNRQPGFVYELDLQRLGARDQTELLHRNAFDTINQIPAHRTGRIGSCRDDKISTAADPNTDHHRRHYTRNLAMKSRLCTFACLLLLVFLTHTAHADDVATKPINVLMIGNSQCPTIVRNRLIENLAASDKGARPIKIGGCIKGGASLKSHWEAGTGPESARGMIATGTWDFVVLQDIYNVQAPAFQPYARQFHELIKDSGARTVLFGTASIISDYPQGFERLHRLHLDMGKELGVPVVDASHAYFRYLGDKPSTERMESLFAKDRAHPGLWGSYIYSCGIYSVITGRSPVGLAAPAEIPAAAVKELQEAAWGQHQETTAALKK